MFTNQAVFQKFILGKVSFYYIFTRDPFKDIYFVGKEILI